MPRDREAGECPFYKTTGSYPTDKLPKRDLGDQSCAVTRRMAGIISRGINTRNFEYWPIAAYSPTIGNHMTAGEISGIYISTHPYGKRDVIFARGSHYEIGGIVIAEIKEDKLILIADRDTRLIVDIVDDPAIMYEDASAANYTPVIQKSLGDWA